MAASMTGQPMGLYVTPPTAESMPRSARCARCANSGAPAMALKAPWATGTPTEGPASPADLATSPGAIPEVLVQGGSGAAVARAVVVGLHVGRLAELLQRLQVGLRPAHAQGGGCGAAQLAGLRKVAL